MLRLMRNWCVCLAFAAIFAGAAGAASVTFLQADTATLGNWKGVYGQDGNVIAQHSVLAPPYSSFNTAGAINLYLKDLWSTDPRALLKQTYSYSATERIESFFHTPSSMDFLIGAADAAPHRIALYFCDYERSGRSVTVQTIDSAAGTILDSRQLTNYTAGVYLVYTYSGPVTFRIVNNNPGQYTPTGSVNAFFWGGDAGAPAPQTPPADTTAPAVSVTKPSAGQQVADRWFVAADASDNVGVVGVQMMLDGKPLLPEWTSAPYTQQWDTTFTPNGTHTLTAIARDAAGNKTTSAPVQVVVNNATAPSVPAGSVTYVGTDSVTLGNWKGVYGQDGSFIAPNSSVPPGYGSFSAGSNTAAVVDQNATDTRALQTSTGRIESYWTTGTTMDFQVGAADGHTHRIALYFCDYENLGRLATLKIYDAASNNLLESRSLPLYGNPLYLVYTYTGNVIFRVVNQSPSAQPGAVVSGFFWGGDGLPTAGSGADTTAPAVSFNSPAGGSTLSGNVTLTASATDNVGVASVQFKVDGTNIGQPVTAAPYTISWDSRTVANGSHMLYAIARDAAANTASSAVSVTVDNVAAPPPAANGLTFLGTDTTTKGNWKGVYGQDGNFIAEHSYNAPPYSVFNAIDTNRLLIDIWTNDNRAPLKQYYSYTAAERVMSQWYSRYSMDFQVSAVDGNPHRVAIYFADWQPMSSPAAFPQKRSITVQAIRTDTGAVLDTRALTAYTGGVYLVYQYTGKVTFRVQNNYAPLDTNPNANVSAFFWGGSGMTQ
jgi:hypothetical protein